MKIETLATKSVGGQLSRQSVKFGREWTREELDRIISGLEQLENNWKSEQRREKNWKRSVPGFADWSLSTLLFTTVDYYLRSISDFLPPISTLYPPINTANEIWLSINHSWRYEFGRWECSIPGHNFEFRSAYSVTGLKGRLNGELTRYIHGNSRGTRGIYFISKPRGRSNLNFQNFQFKSFFPMEF